MVAGQTFKDTEVTFGSQLKLLPRETQISEVRI